ncbi:dTDP-4-dehydrorhamnose reductase [Flavobacterium sp. MFBS3-15]|uniref:dTDP-4-dehydrorhamnose reductase n=1 Tax=Flavobacterium sp. MFBS3-15 TaxID=2989816 RepID=UPI0022365081|nr:dTDP-4-dehydrorhamnose reductase [Flavobacterium sp. MFBS3-15]MCW4469143.1 dTDP-4-dehydrorhamnose reductase [Flavobacterium sp. MFBS3-15]
MVVLVTGGNGQLGQALQALVPKHEKNLKFYFAGSQEADITNKESLNAIFKKIKPDFCINAAAYTAVDKAESEPEKAHSINAEGATNLAEVCKEYRTTLLHISTDFVFEGQKKSPYTEKDETNPQGVYGLTKLQGELEIQNILPEHFIIRTSWLYSEYGNNFMKTMIRLAGERDSISVVDDQKGTPTNANDLAAALVQMISSGIEEYGIYHYSNEGEGTWYDFAKKIFEVNNITIDLRRIPTSAYPTPAKRPEYSVMDKSKIKKAFGIEIPDWQQSLADNTARQ